MHASKHNDKFYFKDAAGALFFQQWPDVQAAIQLDILFLACKLCGPLS